MRITDIFRTNEYREYDFTCVFKEKADLKKCVDNIRKLFEKHIGLNNVSCDWKVVEDNDSKKLKGVIITIPEWQHRFKKRVGGHDCGDFFIRVA